MEEQLPPFQTDDEGQDLGWHALNYRTAHPLQAQLMYEELVRYVLEYARLAVAQERERCAELAKSYATCGCGGAYGRCMDNDVPLAIAAAIRKG